MSLRNFCLKATNGSLWVNEYLLAELSPYFEAACFRKCWETSAREIEFKEIDIQTLTVFMEYVHPEDFLYNKVIDEHNALILIQLSDRFIFPSVRREIEFFLESKHFKTQQFKPEFLFELLLVAWAHEFKCTYTDPILKKIRHLSSDTRRELISQLSREHRHRLYSEMKASENV